MRACLPLIVSALLLLSTAPARATTLLRLPIESLTSAATDVVIGVVSQVVSRYTDDGSQIMTYVTISGVDRLKGEPTEGDLTFAQWGGQVGDDVLNVIGAPTWIVGEQALLFLTRMESDPAYSVATDSWILGLSQGKWTVFRDEAGNPVAVNAASLSGSLVGPPTADAPDRIALDALRERIRDAIRVDAPVREGN